MKKSYQFTLVILSTIIIILASITFFISYKNKHAVLEGAVDIFSNKPGEAPYSDLLGNPVSLEQYLGKILVVVSWASWSPFSQADLTMMIDLAKEYSSEEVIFMAINRKETKEQAARYVQTLPTLTGLVVALDPRDYFYAAVGGYAMPEAVVFNQRGEEVKHFRGVAPRDEIKSAIAEIKSKTN